MTIREPRRSDNCIALYCTACLFVRGLPGVEVENASMDGYQS